MPSCAGFLALSGLRATDVQGVQYNREFKSPYDRENFMPQMSQSLPSNSVIWQEPADDHDMPHLAEVVRRPNIHCLHNGLDPPPVANLCAHHKRSAVSADEIPQFCLQSTTLPSLRSISTLCMHYSAFAVTAFSLSAFRKFFLYVIS